MPSLPFNYWNGPVLLDTPWSHFQCLIWKFSVSPLNCTFSFTNSSNFLVLTKARVFQTHINVLLNGRNACSHSPPLAFCSVWLLFPSDMIFSQLFKSSKPQHLSCLNGNNTCLMIAGKLLKCNREKCLVFYSFNTVFHTANQVYSLHDPARGMRVRAEKLYLEELTGRSQGCPLRV